MEITVKTKLLKALPGPVERLFNSDDATDFFKGVTRVNDDLRKVQILAAMAEGMETLTLAEVTEVDGCIGIVPQGDGMTRPVFVSLPLITSTWPRMAAYRKPGSGMVVSAPMALANYGLPNVRKLAAGTFEGCSWGDLAAAMQGSTPGWWPYLEEIESGAFADLTADMFGEPMNLALPYARRIGAHIFGAEPPGSDLLTVTWSPGNGDTEFVSESAFAGCGFQMALLAYDQTHKEIERMANFPWGLNDRTSALPAKVHANDQPEGSDHWVIERDPETGSARLVAP